MSPDTLRTGAILVADAHCAPWRTPFLDFLRALEKGEVKTPQLVLMGDIFDLLFGPIETTHALNAEAIDILNRLSRTVEIVYLEGNHDFLLGDLFPHVRVIPRERQPWIAVYEEKQIALSHGDSAMGWEYEAYTSLIRSPFVLKILRAADKIGRGWIVRGLERMMQRKHHCKTIGKFEALVSHRLKGQTFEGADTLIEGHFHQNRALDLGDLHYINLAAFACGERYYRLRPPHDQPLLNETVFRKEL